MGKRRDMAKLGNTAVQPPALRLDTRNRTTESILLLSPRATAFCCFITYLLDPLHVDGTRLVACYSFQCCVFAKRRPDGFLEASVCRSNVSFAQNPYRRSSLHPVSFIRLIHSSRCCGDFPNLVCNSPVPLLTMHAFVRCRSGEIDPCCRLEKVRPSLL